MATFEISPFRSSSVGFDRPWDQWHTTMSHDAPAYDILKTGEDAFRISLAVPGFNPEDITIETREGSVWIKGEHETQCDDAQYLYRSIGAQAFQRTFQLPEHVKVKEARLDMGILHIELVRELPEALRPRRIEIQHEDTPRPVLEDSSKAA